MRGFVSLLFAAALAAHLGPAGAPSLGGAPVCSEEVGALRSVLGHVLYLTSALGSAQTEAAPNGRERTGGAVPRRAVPETTADRCRAVAMVARRRPESATPPSLLGFCGHPTTAPPLQA